jgi:hypothetical protein
MNYKKSKLGKLDFVEYYLYEEPTDTFCKYFRGISVDFKNNSILNISLCHGESETWAYTKPEPKPTWLRIDNRGLFPREFYIGDNDDERYQVVIQRYFKLEDIDLCKQECVNIFDRYVKFFVE